MKPNKIFLPLNTVILIVFISLPSYSFADSFVVKKVKGKQAVIESTTELQEGKVYNLENDTKDTLAVSVPALSSFKSRYNSISLNIDMSFIKGSKTTENDFNLNARYGWNHTHFEFGPAVILDINNYGFGVNTNYLIGGYFDYNSVPNRSPRDLVYGPSGQFLIGNKNSDSGSRSQLTQIQASGFVTWFINQSPVAIRTEVGYVYKKVNSSSNETNLSGAVGKMFLMYYF